MIYFINVNKLYYVVDIDIKGFFDNVDHGMLLKQLWAMGIRDKCLLSILSKMLKAEVLGVGIMVKGTPQGGILSPLLANIYLNELDWWLESKKNKGIKFVRFADNFKIFCPNYAVAKDMLIKVAKWDIINVKHGEDYKIKIPCIRGKPLEVIGNTSYNFKQYRGNRNFYDPNSRKLFQKKITN